MSTYNIHPLAFSKRHYILAKQSGIFLPPLLLIPEYGGRFELAAELHGTHWLARIDAGHFALEADLAASGTFLGRYLDAGHFGMEADLTTTGIYREFSRDAGRFELKAELKGDVAAPIYFDAGRFALEADLAASGTLLGRYLDAGRFALEADTSASYGYAVDGHLSLDADLQATLLPTTVIGEIGVSHFKEQSSFKANKPTFISGMLSGFEGSIETETSAWIENELPTIQGELITGGHLSIHLSALEGQATAEVKSVGQIGVTLKALQGRVTGGIELKGNLPSLSGEIEALRQVDGQIRRSISPLKGQIQATSGISSKLKFTLRALTGEITASTAKKCTLQGTLPSVKGQLEAKRHVNGNIVGSLSRIRGELKEEVPVIIPDDLGLHATMPVITGQLGVVTKIEDVGVLRFMSKYSDPLEERQSIEYAEDVLRYGG